MSSGAIHRFHRDGRRRRRLTVTFVPGAVYDDDDVPPEVTEDFRTANPGRP